jgi:nucleoside-diphosphate-sugar epimerase
VFLSSYLYGNPRELPIAENAPISVTNPYALSKKLAEEVCEFYADRLGVSVMILRPFNAYGPGQKEPFLIPSIIGQVKRGGPVRVQDLEPKRDYVYIADLVEAIASSVNLRYSFNVINVGSGVSHSVADVIQIIQDITGRKLEIKASGERRPNEVMDTVADISKAKEVLGWTPRWTISQGIKAILAEE